MNILSELINLTQRKEAVLSPRQIALQQALSRISANNTSTGIAVSFIPNIEKMVGMIPDNECDVIVQMMRDTVREYDQIIAGE